MPTLNTSDPSKPDYVRAEVVAAAPDLQLIADLLEGTRAMHRNAVTYIREWDAEDRTVWRRRATTEQLYEGFGRTVSASVGKLFATPPQMEWPTQQAVMEALWDNIDGKGTKGSVAAKHFAHDAIADGYALILVDHPAAPDGTVVTRANEAALNLRPRWAFYARSAVLSWRTAVANNVEYLAMLTLAETEEQASAFGVSTTQYVRELYADGAVAGWRRWRLVEVDGQQSWTLDSDGVFRNRVGQTRATIPVSIGYAGRSHGWCVARPPLLGVAWANLGHWQQASNLRFYRELAAFPQPTIIGNIVDETGTGVGQLKLGPLVLVHLKGDGMGGNAEFKWTELTGTALEQVEAGVRAKEQEIAAMGLSFMSRDTRAAETAEAKRLDAAAEDSTLATAGQAIEDALNQAAVDTAWFMGLDATQAFTVTLNRDYERATLAPQMVQAITALVKEGMPVKRAVDMLIAGGVLKATPEEAEDIALEWDAGRVAVQDAEAEAEAANAEMRRAA
jgi:hypothetical protein